MMTVLGTGDKGREQVTLVLTLGEGMRDAALRAQIKAEVEQRNRTLRAKQARLVLCTPPRGRFRAA